MALSGPVTATNFTIWTLPKKIQRMTLCHRESLSRSHESPSPPRMFWLSLDSAQECCLARVNADNLETEVKVALLTFVHLLNKKKNIYPFRSKSHTAQSRKPPLEFGPWRICGQWGSQNSPIFFPVDSKQKDIKEEPCQSPDQPSRYIGFFSS